MSEITLLPDNLEACHSLIARLAVTITELHGRSEKFEQENAELNLTIQHLLQQLKGHRRERAPEDPNQLTIDFGEEPPSADALAEAAAEAEGIVQESQNRRRTRKPKKPRNEQLPAHLPRYEVPAPGSQEAPVCPIHGPRQKIGEDRIETLEFLRPQLQVRVTVYPKFACSSSADCGVEQPPRERGLVEGNRYDTSVAAEILTAKYAYHLPVYRQQDLFAGSGWTPSRSTLLNLIAAAAQVLEPLANHFRQLVRRDAVIGTDDTRVTLLLPQVIPEPKPDDPRSQRIHEVFTAARAEGRPSVSARMWAYRAVERPVQAFDFTVSHHRDGPDDFLEEYSGKLMADCYSGYQNIDLRSESRIQRGACWSHVRRKVLEGHSSHPLESCVLLAMIGELYDVEVRGKLLSAEERRILREQCSRPVMARIKQSLESEAADRVLPKSIFAEAVRYLRNHWDPLQLYLTDGLMPIDNNEVEQLMKQIALGRKNWLFLGSVDAGYRAATILTIVSTAHRNDLDVWAYLKDVLDTLLAGSKDYESLQADVWKLSHPESVRTYRADERRDRIDAVQLRRARRRLQKLRSSDA